MKPLFYFSFLSLFFLGCQPPQPLGPKDLSQIIPAPQVTYLGGQSHLVSQRIAWSIPPSFDLTKTFLENHMTPHGFELIPVDAEQAQWGFLVDSALGKGAYQLSIEPDRLTLSAADDLGAFYGAQSLRQLMPEYLEENTSEHLDFYLPTGLIKDRPKFAYRGMHLDVGRHFFGPDDIKKYIDYLAMLKMNYFHWHLTEDQGWRIEIKAYPRLTQHGAVRQETLLGHYSDQPHEFDKTPYGGFYTQEEVKDIVAYAAQKHITIIPEIEMPGHAQAAISAYPELGCTHQAVPVATKWGIFEDIYCASEQTFSFLETVLEEVMALFPGPYIHIGGDEAPKAHWSDCPNCQGVIQARGLADEHELQSYFITRIEAFINAHDKQIIGWDEILEGGLAPNATVMSWRGTEGGIQAAKQHHPVIMTPTSHCYFDYYQSDLPEEPLAIGGYLPLKKVFSYNPIPHELSKEEAQYVLGAQGNVWTEYMPDFKQVEYMVFPRILALSEVVWHGPAKAIDPEYAQFTMRVAAFLKRLDAMGVNYANHLYDLESVHRVERLSPGNSDSSQGKTVIRYALVNPLENHRLEYRLNQGQWTLYKGPLSIDTTSGVQARLMLDGQQVGRIKKDSLLVHSGLGLVSSVAPQPHSSYNAGGIQALTNGKRGDNNRYGDTEWLGFWGEDVRVSLKAKKLTAAVNSLEMRFYQSPGQWIYVPKSVEVSMDYADGSSQKVQWPIAAPKRNGPFAQRWDLPIKEGAELTGFEIRVPSFGIIPEGQQGAGQKSWTFIDEIILQ